MIINKKEKTHYFIDEAGDTTFYGKKRKEIIGSNGVSNSFIIGMVKINESVDEVRSKISELQNKIKNNPFYQVPSVLKKIESTGYYLHATDDIPEIRKEMFDLIKRIDCTFEAVVGRKNINKYETDHKGKEELFYSDLLSHLLKGKLNQNRKIILNISQRGKSTKNTNLDLALTKAKQKLKSKTIKHKFNTEIVFNVNYPTNDSLLNLADYFCWVVQRVFEKGEVRYYNYIKEKIVLIVDLYDTDKYKDNKNYYHEKNLLQKENKISPPKH